VLANSDVPIQVGSEDEARQAVRDLVALGVDFVKIWVDDNRQVSGQMFSGGRLVSTYSSVPKLSPALYGAIIDEAHQNNVRVAAHVRNLADAKGLVGAGVDGIIHSIRDQAVCGKEAQWSHVFIATNVEPHGTNVQNVEAPDMSRETSTFGHLSIAVNIGILSMVVALSAWQIRRSIDSLDIKVGDIIQVVDHGMDSERDKCCELCMEPLDDND